MQLSSFVLSLKKILLFFIIIFLFETLLLITSLKILNHLSEMKNLLYQL